MSGRAGVLVAARTWSGAARDVDGHAGSAQAARVPGSRQRGLPLLAKRAIDCAVAGAALLATAPVLAGAALAVRATMGSPVLFRQKRPGLYGKPFEVVKLRTMSNARDATGRLRTDAERLTAVGRFIRATSLDELPQLWTVLRGDMSLVGPRPLMMQYLERYSPEQARRHDVLPGITGWAQIHGRNAVAWDERFALDVWYVDHWTVALDLEIVARTVVTVVSGRGVSEDGHATKPEFMGSAAHSGTSA